MKNKKTTLEIYIKKQKLAANTEQTVDVLVRITPPDLDVSSKVRPKLNLGMVLDRSGSMDETKMREARKAVKYCVDQMLAEDRFSTVIFCHEVEVLFESQKMNAANKTLLKSKIDKIESGGSTALHEAWVSGGLQVARHLDDDTINRVILVTDGLANVGVTDPNRIKRQAGDLLKKGLSTSTIGIGRDFNEDLLMPMAEAGGGNAWHVQESDDMTRIFSAELNGLIGQIGKNVTLRIKTRQGVRVVDLLNDFEIDHSLDYILPNLQAGSPLDIIVKLQIGSGDVGDKLDAAEFSIRYLDQDSGHMETLSAGLRCEFADIAEIVDLPENLEVTRATQLLMNARARLEAMTHLDRFDRYGAIEMLRAVVAPTEALFSLTDSPAVKAELERELNELARQSEKIQLAEDDLMARKQMAYGRHSRTRGR